MRAYRVVFIVMCAWGWAATGAAQEPAADVLLGAVRGTITDETTGDSLPNAGIFVFGTTSATVTSSSGVYTLSNLPAGSYVLQASFIGYRTQQVEIQVLSGTVVTADIALESSQDSIEFSLIRIPDAQLIPTTDIQFPFPDTARLDHLQVEFLPFDAQRGRAFSLQLLDTVAVRVEAQAIVQVSDSMLRWTGTVLDATGTRRGSVILIVLNGRLTGTVRYNGRFFSIRPVRPGIHVVVEVDSRKLSIMEPPMPPSPPPGPPERPIPTPEPQPVFPQSPSFLPEWFQPFEEVFQNYQTVPMACTDVNNFKTGPVPEIRALVAYTNEVAAADGDILGEIELMVTETNQAFDSTDINLRLVVAHTEQVTADDTKGVSIHLDELVETSDGTLDDIHSLRDEHHADVVILIVETPPGGGGFAFIMRRVSRHAYADSAFAVLAHAEALYPNFLFAHELGHVLGARHDRDPYSPLGEPYTHNFGFVGPSSMTSSAVSSCPCQTIVPPDYWKTIMAASGTHERIKRFSNPDVLYQGTPLGIPTTQQDAADNRRTLHNTSAVVASYRLTPVWFVAAGGASPWRETRVADDQLPNVRFGDFNGDGITDAFRINTVTQEWEWSDGVSGPWLTLNEVASTAAIPLDEMVFVDLDGDGYTDVFRSDVAAEKWLWVEKGKGAWVDLNIQNPKWAIPVTQLGFGDFDGGGVDVFRSIPPPGTWEISSGGSGPWLSIGLPPNTPANTFLPPSLLGFEDFDGDGTTDVFVSTVDDGWYWSRSGTDPWQPLNALADPLSRLAFGDFDGDGKTDAFKTDGINWYLSPAATAELPGATGAWEILNTSCHRLPVLAFGDFDGDGTTDVFRTGIRP